MLTELADWQKLLEALRPDYCQRRNVHEEEYSDSARAPGAGPVSGSSQR